MAMVSHQSLLATAAAAVSRARQQCSDGPADQKQKDPYSSFDQDPYGMNPALQAPMRAIVLSFVLLFTSAAMACEKHINGHQNSSDTHSESINN
jgi:hypothetical protein